MSAMKIEEIVALLPTSEQKEARDRIINALAAGWTSIGIWDGVDKDGNWLPPDQSDLFGNSPEGKFGSIPYLEKSDGTSHTS